MKQVMTGLVTVLMLGLSFVPATAQTQKPDLIAMPAPTPTIPPCRSSSGGPA